MKRRSRHSSGLNSEINITPLVDVVLVLLIIFMVVTPYLQQGVEVKLPFAANAAAGEAEEHETVIISLTADGSTFVGRDRRTRDQLVTELRAAVARNPEVEILVKGDEHVRFRQVRSLLEWLRDAGAPAASLATNKESEG